MAFACAFAFGATAQTKQAVNATQQRDPLFMLPATPAQQNPNLPTPLLISGYYAHGFEPTTFPPTGWNRFNVSGSNQWARSTAQAHTGTASAYMQYQTTAAEDWLIMPRFLAGASTDSVTFWMRLAYVGYPPDSLSIKVSTTDSLPSSFSTTLLHLREGVNYPPNATTWYRYKVSLAAYVGQQIYIAFKHYNNNGDGLYIDDVTIGTKPAAEIMTSGISTPASVALGTLTPQASFYNNGSATQSFNVTMEISPGGYTSTMPVTSLNPSTSTTVSFASWTPSAAGIYTLKAYSSLAGDANMTNDTITKTIQVLSAFPNNGWSAQTALPSGRWATAPVFVKPCVSGTDTGYVYLISGADASFANTTANLRYNTVTGTWSTMAPIPTSRTQITPVELNNKIYVIGGYGGSFSPVATNSIYDITTNTWSAGASMPTAVGDYAIATYGDSLIYVVGGYTGSGDVNTVQIYSVNTNTWTTGTIKPGNAVAGGRMGITGNNIVFAGGYSQASLSQSAAYLGVINPANPQSITWSSISAYPGGTSSRLGAGTSLPDDGRVYFGGGDPNGAGTSVLNTIYAYNTATSQWETGPNMITGVSNISGFAGAVHNNTRYLITMGGYNGTAVTTSNEWISLGAAPAPYAQADTAICTGSSFALDAYDGFSYSWSPSTGLSSTTTATTTASPTATTTYTVTMSRGYGCPVQDAVTVTVNALPAAAAGSDAAICAGDNITLTATGGDTYAWTPSAGLSNAAIDSPVASPATSTTYTVTVTNTTTGCSNTDDVMITVNALPAAAAGTDAAICAGDNITLTATGGDAYAWTPSAGLSNAAIDSPVASPATSTTYTVTVTNTTTGCSNTDDIMITVNALPAAAAGTDAAVCAGSSTGLLATGGDSYMWSPSAGLDNDMIDNPTATPASTTTYTVTVTDAATGCSNTDDVTVTVNDLPAVTTNATDATCYSNNDGAATASVTGTSTYSYSWSTGGTAATESNLAAGSYTVTVTDDVTGCQSQSIVTISEPAPISITVMNDTVTGCTGTLAATVTGGTGPYTYLWNDPSAQTNDTAVGLCVGTYTVMITDNNGCIRNGVADVVLSTGIEAVTANNNINVYPNPSAGVIAIQSSFTSGQQVTITLVNVLGEQAMMIDEGKFTGMYTRTVDISSLSAGIYYIKVLEGNEIVSVKKIVKQ